MSDDHSGLDPPLPIPNRTVKQDRADDSADYPCESRSSSDSYQKKPLLPGRGFFICPSSGDSSARPRMVARLSQADHLRAGDRIELGLRPESIVLFDADGRLLDPAHVTPSGSRQAVR
jgi:hypothetical protein